MPATGTTVTLGKTRRRGVDAQLSLQLGDDWTVWASHAYQEAKITRDDRDASISLQGREVAATRATSAIWAWTTAPRMRCGWACRRVHRAITTWKSATWPASSEASPCSTSARPTSSPAFQRGPAAEERYRPRVRLRLVRQLLLGQRPPHVLAGAGPQRIRRPQHEAVAGHASGSGRACSTCSRGRALSWRTGIRPRNPQRMRSDPFPRGKGSDEPRVLHYIGAMSDPHRRRPLKPWARRWPGPGPMAASSAATRPSGAGWASAVAACWASHWPHWKCRAKPWPTSWHAMSATACA